QYSTSTSITVGYSANDPGSYPSGLNKVELWAKAPGGSFAKVDTDTSPGASGSFNYTATVDGSYDFYTRAIDKAGNYEAAPASADTTTLVDTQAPISTASVPDYETNTTFNVSYTASDPLKNDSNSGLDKIELWAKGPSDSAFAKVATDSGVAIDNAFNYGATE